MNPANFGWTRNLLRTDFFDGCCGVPFLQNVLGSLMGAEFHAFEWFLTGLRLRRGSAVPRYKCVSPKNAGEKYGRRIFWILFQKPIPCVRQASASRRYGSMRVPE